MGLSIPMILTSGGRMGSPEMLPSIDIQQETSLSPSHIAMINQKLEALQQQCQTEFILLAEDNGHTISVLTEQKMPEKTSLGSLVTGSMATSTEIARYIGLDLNDQMILREGIKSITCTANIGTSLVLFILINKEVPLGWVRQMVHETVCQLAEIITPLSGGNEMSIPTPPYSRRKTHLKVAS
jgi:predicted regulator of Ras-like GTPase activity (Roadblock/LC7/MglB family)